MKNQQKIGLLKVEVKNEQKIGLLKVEVKNEQKLDYAQAYVIQYVTRSDKKGLIAFPLF